MPLSKIQFRPGTNREGTTYANEGGWYEMDKVRFRSGFPEKIGGWARYSTYTFVGVCRNLWNWVTFGGSNLTAVGTNSKMYIENGGKYFDITPLTDTSPVTLAADPFAVVSGSKKVTVTDVAHGATTGTWVTFSGATVIGGLTLNGEFEIVTILDADIYTIASATASNATASGGGAVVDADYQISAGGALYTEGVGWGAGAWGRGTWGSPSTVGVGAQLRLWSLDSYGEDFVFAARNGAIYYWALDLSTYARAATLSSLSTTAGFDGTYVPTAVSKLLTSDIQRFTIALGANPYDPGNPNTTFDPMLVRWSDQENVYQWVPSVTNQSGELRLSDGSAIITGKHTRQETLIWTDTSLFSMQYIGPPYVYGFTSLASNISVASPGAVATANGVSYWMGVDKFYMYSGRVETLPCTLRQYVFGDINTSQAYQITAGTNEGFNEVWWFYPSADSLVNDRYVIFNHLERIWYYGSLGRTGWLDSPLRTHPMGAYSTANSYLASGISDAVTSLPLLDASTYPASGVLTIESEVISYTGNDGANLTGCVRGVMNTTAASHLAYTPVTNYTANQIVSHEYGVDDNSTDIPAAISGYIQSSDFDIGDGHNFGFVWRILPDITFSGSTAANPVVTMTIRPRQNSGTAYGTADSPTVTRTSSYPVEVYTGQVYTRLRGRQMAFKVSSEDLGVTWQLGSPRIDIRPDGRR